MRESEPPSFRPGASLSFSEVLQLDLPDQFTLVEFEAYYHGARPFAERYPEQYAIYRVYDYDPRNRTGDLFVLIGNPRDHVALTPTQFRATWTE